MDQVKKLMAGIYKYGFWLSCGLIAIASVAIGVMATMQVQDNATKQVARIKTAISNITPISGKKDHPNAKTTAAWDNVNLDLERRVFQLWKQNFFKQRTILTWPIEVGADFNREIQDQKYYQPELLAFPELPPGLLSRQARDQYRNYIIEELPKLALIIDAKWHLDLSNSPVGGPGGMGPGGMGPGGKVGGPPGGIGGVGGPPGGIGGVGGEGGEGGGIRPGGGIGGMGSSQIYDPLEVVAWDASSQQLLATKVLRGMNRSDTPSTLDILYAQEDLWIVKALLNVIAKTNGDALERHRAPVKEIRTLSTGQDAGTKVGGIKLLHAASTTPSMGAPGAPGVAAGGPPTTGAPVVGKSGAGGPPGGNPYEGGGNAAATAHPAELRYVDKKFTFKAWNEIKSAIESDAFADVELALAKRVPFRMTLIMDQRELNKLLVNCGNNELMVEVSQVRYNPQAVSTSSMPGGSSPMGGPPGGAVGGPPGGTGGMPTAPGAGGMGGKGGPGSGGAGLGGEDGGGSGAGGMGGNTGSSVQIAGPVGLSPYDISVDIFGYVQIYNIPATKKFKLLEAATGTANGATTPAPAGTNPVAAPATTGGEPAATPPAAGDAPAESKPAESTPPAAPADAKAPPNSTPAEGGAAPANGGAAPAGDTPPPANGGPPANSGGAAPGSTP